MTQPTGVDFVHADGGSGKRFIVEYISAGLATFDYDGDGLTDLYFLNGGQLEGSPTVPVGNRLYRNLGNWRFVDVTDVAGVGDKGHGLGIAVGDLDNDGDPDLVLNNFGPNALYWNQGDGTFLKDMSTPMRASDQHVGAGVCLLDADADGNLDMFVSNYVDFSYENHPQRKFRGQSVYPSPQDFAPTIDRLYVNRGDGRFYDRTAASGLDAMAGTGMGAIALDYDGDADTDIYVCNDVMSNFLWENDGEGNYIEVGLLAGVAVDFAGVMQGSMGVECGDINGDGHLDLIATSYQDEFPVVYQSSGSGFFEDVTVAQGDLHKAVPDVTWGIGLVDFEHDGDLDLFMASGHLMDNVAKTDDTQTYAAPNLLFIREDGGLMKADARHGTGLQSEKVSRGAAFDDLDNDGDLDIVILNSNAPATLIRNDSQAAGNWIELELVGATATRDAYGARVVVESGDDGNTRQWVAEAHAGRGYQSHYGDRMHFGVGDANSLNVQVTWVGGEQERFEGLSAAQRHTLIQGQGKSVP